MDPDREKETLPAVPADSREVAVDLSARRLPEDPGAAATQLSILLQATNAVVEEEFKRSQRLDEKSRNQATVVGALFAIVQAFVVSLINGSLSAGDGFSDRSGFVVWLAIAGGLAGIALFVSLILSYRSWRLLDDVAAPVDPDDEVFKLYLSAAVAGNPRVAEKLVNESARIGLRRRHRNAQRVQSFVVATIGCGVVLTVLLLEFVLACVAVALR
ncbi:MAG: hypothetical protein H0U51_00480 [Propionibacteriales bacterium]|nr:hypothetical protein [Propionibacteriales bacterium]